MTRQRILRIVLLITGLMTLAWFAVGANNAGITFDHPFHVTDAEMACEGCHVGIMDTQIGDRVVMPDHSVCEMCHDVEDDGECATCHEGEAVAMPARFIGDQYTNYSHSSHQEFNCDECHGSVATSDPVFPESETCLTCHEHLEATPNTHRLASWHSDHGMDAMMSESECAVCHTQSSCDECHQGENVLANAPHPPEWRFSHGLETMYGQECLTCHETRDECITCHRAVVPTPHDLGPNFANTVNGGAHVDEAKGFILACLSCHDIENDDPTCARCHD
ncbi:hypothetical protein BMS3Bbin04_01306 [bacterium BMS3Bbin04]|nr:hypothetical protein BMS3Bbin04_01306 [bacterium BMS3Bbin04]